MTTTEAGGRGRRWRLVVLAAAALAAGCDGPGGEEGRSPTTTGPGGATGARTTPPPEPLLAGERRPERVSFLTRADSCERFADAVRPLALQAVGPYGFSGSSSFLAVDQAASTASGGRQEAAAAAPAPTAVPRAGVDFSGTNVQEAGVDEPDLVKTDGRLLVTTADGRLRVLDVTGAPRQVGALDLPGGVGNLLLVGTRALVLSDAGRSGPVPVRKDQAGAPTPPRPTTTVTVVDLADPARPRITRTHTIDGGYVDARLVGGVARVITRSTPDISFPEAGASSQRDPKRAQETNAEIVRRAGARAFLPEGASCADAHVPAEPSGAGTVAVQSVDPAAEAPGPPVTVVADASTVYASASRVFVATNRSASQVPVDPDRPTSQGSPAPEPVRTAIHAFDITDPAKARYVGSGDVPGRLLNQFSLSEDAGVLRVATTLDGAGPPAGGNQAPSGPPEAAGAASTEATQSQSQSRVTVLRPAGDEWVETGAVDGLGRGERIYAVRFLGSTGYVVTFRQVDPLYVLDLRDVRAPRVTGELKITGYSAYLHPAGDGRLLGIGQEATDQGRRLGTQLSLFDVRDPAAPAKLAGAVLASSSSSAESDHHAFLFWPASGLVVAPVHSYGDVLPMPGIRSSAAQGFVGAVAYRVGARDITEAGRITHPGSTPIERSLVVGDRLLTLSRVGVATNDLRSMADGGFLPFR